MAKRFVYAFCNTEPRRVTARLPASSRVITLDAKPEPISMDVARTALIVVDMQNGFGTKGGMFDRAGIDISQIQAAVGPTGRVIAAARLLGIKIVYLSGLSRLPSFNSKLCLTLPACRERAAAISAVYELRRCP